MAITASDNSSSRDFKKVSPGCHFAICNSVIDLGIQETSFQGKAKQTHKVYLRFEVPDERVTYEKDGKEIEAPCSIGTTYTLSLSEKSKLRPLLENWRGKLFTKEELKGFDITTVAGKCCQIIVQHAEGSDGRTYANITSVIATSKEQRERVRTAKSEVGVLVYELDKPDAAVYEKLPNWIKEKLADRVKPASVTNATAAAPDDFSDDIPF